MERGAAPWDQAAVAGSGAEPARVHLVGGSVDDMHGGGVLGPFVDDVRRGGWRGGSRPRLLLVMADDSGRAADFRPGYVDALNEAAGTPFAYVDVWLDGHDGLESEVLDGVDGIVIAGGPTPIYLKGLLPAAAALQSAVGNGVPYLGFSAGAMVSASTAIMGGWRDAGKPVCDEDWSEGLDEVTLNAGLALVDFTVEVHATQGGLLTRALSAAGHAGAETVVAIDEGTCLSVPLGSSRQQRWSVRGAGFVWIVDSDDSGVLRVQRIAESPTDDPILRH